MVEGQLLIIVFPCELRQVARDLPAHGTCQAGNVLVAGCGQRVEQKASIGLLRVHTVHRDDVEMDIQIQRGTESLHDGQASGLQPTAQLAPPGAAAQVGVDGADECAKHHARGIGGIGHLEAQLVRDAEYVLPSRHVAKKLIHAKGGGVGHPATKAAWAKSTPLARERHDPAVPTVFTSDAKKAVHENATTKVRLEFVKHEGGQFAAPCFQVGEER